MNFWLTVLTGISDPTLVFGFHSSHVVTGVLIHQRPKDWTLTDPRVWVASLGVFLFKRKMGVSDVDWM